MDSKAFFKTLDEGEEYMILMVQKRNYKYIPDDIRQCVYISYVGQKNDELKNDPLHKELVSNERKAKKELRDYRYLKNNQ